MLRVAFTSQCCSGWPSAPFAKFCMDILDINITAALSFLTPSEELHYFTAPVLPANTTSNNTCEDKQVACVPNPCLNNATCETRESDYKCKCLEGFEGKQCEHDTNTCTRTNCINGFCELIEGFETCICFDSYLGTNCEYEIQNCSLYFCIHGKCFEKSSIRCRCEEGFSGDGCHPHRHCNQNLFRFGECVILNETRNAKCSCFEGYTGDFCDRRIEYCSPNPCYNGTCVESIGEFVCVCNKGYSGSLCEDELPTSQNVTGNTNNRRSRCLCLL